MSSRTTFISSAFTAALLLLLLVTFPDAVTAKNTTVSSSGASQSPPSPPQRFITTWPTVPTRVPDAHLMSPNFRRPLRTNSPNFTRSYHYSTRGSSAVYQWWTKPRRSQPPGGQTGEQVSKPAATSGVPNSPGPPSQPGSLGETTLPTHKFLRLTSAPPLVAGGEVIHCQIQLANNYEKTMNESDTATDRYGLELTLSIAELCRVDEQRISDVTVVEHPDTGKMVLRFNIQPAVKSCYQGCHLNTSKIARRVADLVDSFAFIIWDVNRQALYVDQLPAVYTWTVTGKCPNATCPPGDECDVHLSGGFYCRCADNCFHMTTAGHDDLFALFVIPGVIIIALVLLLLLVLYRKRSIIRNKIGVKTVRDYKPAYDSATLKQQPMLATLDPVGADQLYRALECNLGIAYNEQSFDDLSCSQDSVYSPVSTMHVNAPAKAPENDYSVVTDC